MAASLPSRIRQRPEALLRRRILELILEQILNGLTLGGVYSLVALGLTLVYGIPPIIGALLPSASFFLISLWLMLRKS